MSATQACYSRDLHERWWLRMAAGLPRKTLSGVPIPWSGGRPPFLVLWFADVSPLSEHLQVRAMIGNLFMQSVRARRRPRYHRLDVCSLRGDARLWRFRKAEDVFGWEACDALVTRLGREPFWLFRQLRHLSGIFEFEKFFPKDD